MKGIAEHLKSEFENNSGMWELHRIPEICKVHHILPHILYVMYETYGTLKIGHLQKHYIPACINLFSKSVTEIPEHYVKSVQSSQWRHQNDVIKVLNRFLSLFWCFDCWIWASKSGLVAYICDPVTLDIEFRNGVGSAPVSGNNPSIGGWLCEHL